MSSNDTEATSEPYTGFGGIHGYFTDWETGLQLLGHRYYDPSLGRFLTRDPISYAGGINLYEYCGNSPLNGHDSTGYGVNPGPSYPADPQPAVLGAIECLGDVVKLFYQAASGNRFTTAQFCQAIANCIVSIAFQVLVKWLIASVDWEAPWWFGCIYGAVLGLIHFLVDQQCNKYCGGEQTNPWCAALNVLASTISGCIGGWIETDTMFKLMNSIINAIFGGALDFGAESWCDHYFHS